MTTINSDAELIRAIRREQTLDFVNAARQLGYRVTAIDADGNISTVPLLDNEYALRLTQDRDGSYRTAPSRYTPPTTHESRLPDVIRAYRNALSMIELLRTANLRLLGEYRAD